MQVALPAGECKPVYSQGNSWSQGALEDQVQNSMTWDKRTSLENNQPEMTPEQQSKSNTLRSEKFNRL